MKTRISDEAKINEREQNLPQLSKDAMSGLRKSSGSRKAFAMISSAAFAAGLLMPSVAQASRMPNTNEEKTCVATIYASGAIEWDVPLAKPFTMLFENRLAPMNHIFQTVDVYNGSSIKVYLDKSVEKLIPIHDKNNNSVGLEVTTAELYFVRLTPGASTTEQISADYNTGLATLLSSEPKNTILVWPSERTSQSTTPSECRVALGNTLYLATASNIRFETATVAHILSSNNYIGPRGVQIK